MKTKLFSLEIWKFILPLMLLLYISKSNAQCSPDVLMLLTQADVDNFGATYPSVTDWDGSIQVGDYDTTSNITNLAGLSNLVSICGTLDISKNPLLPNLNGLENLTNLGRLDIFDNPLLTNLEGLNNLNSVENLFFIGDNDVLIDLQGLGNLNSVNALNLYNNNSLINLEGLGNLNLGGLDIFENPLFTTLSGLNLLNSHMEAVSIMDNPSLENIDALLSLTSANSVQIALNDILDNLNGLSNLATVTSIIIEGPNLTDLDGLQNLTSVGEMRIPGGNILNINGLSNLLHAETLRLYDFNYLENLSGLENLTSLKNLALGNCPLLNSIDALENVVFLDYDPEVDYNLPFVSIVHNPLLGECSIAPLCDKITDPEFVFFVEGNAIGCESIEAVIDGCNLGTTEVSLNSIKIFPNPSNSIVNISGNNITQVKIFDMIDRKVLDVQIENNTFNVEKLASGRYVAQLIGNGGAVIIENLIVE